MKFLKKDLIYCSAIIIVKMKNKLSTQKNKCRKTITLSTKTIESVEPLTVMVWHRVELPKNYLCFTTPSYSSFNHLKKVLAL